MSSCAVHLFAFVPTKWKISLSPGDTRELTFTLSAADLRFYNAQLEYINEAGAFKVYVGTNSRDVQEAGFELVW